MDLRFALRSLRRSPGFTLLAIAILALGIGANSAIFSMVYAVVLHPLAYPEPDRLVALSNANRNGGKYGQVSGPDFVDYRQQSTAFESMAAYAYEVTSVVAASRAEYAGVAAVSPDFFRVLGIQPIEGHMFSNAHAALVSASFWQRHFGDTPFAAGRTLKIFDSVLDISGIVPAGFHFPEETTTEIWFAFADDLATVNRGAHNYRAIARLKRGVTIEQAQAQLTAIGGRLEKAYRGTNQDASLVATPLVDFTVRRVKTSLYTLLAAVSLVLGIACANLANLLLARGAGRTREMAIRAALGAGRARILRQLMVESLVLGAAGCLAGITIAAACLPLLRSLAPAFVPRLAHAAIDTNLLLFSALCGLGSSVLFGLAPALRAGRVDPNQALRAASFRGIVGGSSAKLRQIFVIAELALSMVLLVSAALLLESFSALTSVDLGIRPQRLVVAEVSIPVNSERANQIFYKPLLDQLSTTPLVESAAVTHTLPGQAETRSWGLYVITGQTLEAMKVGGPDAGYSIVSPDYFRTLGIPLFAGRAFAARDDANSPAVAIVSEALARRSFPHADPVGQSILCGLDETSMRWMKIVGVVRDVRVEGPAQAAAGEIYMPYLQHPRQNARVIVNVKGDPLAFFAALRRQILALNPEASLKLSSMENHLASLVSTPRFSTELVTVFAAFAALLAMLGIYGVMAYSVGQRTSEIGLRLALGAQRQQILGLILRQALQLTGPGILAGSVGALAASRVLRSQLFGISIIEPRAYLASLGLLAAISLAAAYLPAWRASRIEPLEALREE